MTPLRRAFEEWYVANFEYPDTEWTDNCGGYYIGHDAQRMWLAFQAGAAHEQA